MRVLGVDPGYGRCGVAVLEKKEGAERLVHSECIETPSGDFPERLRAVAARCERLIEEYAPECLALEKLFFNKSRTTAMRVAEVRGALIALAASRRLPVFEYAPSQVKAAVAGNGRADKRAIQHMVRALVNIEKRIERDDEYDAIAIALTHLACARPRAPAHGEGS